MKYRIIVNLFLRPIGGTSTFRDMAEFIVDDDLEESLSDQIDDEILAAKSRFCDRMKSKSSFDLVSTDTLFCHPAKRS